MVDDAKKSLHEKLSELSLGKRSILVTGGTGFVGRNIARVLADVGHDVTTTGRNRYAAPANCQFIRADLRDRNQVLNASQGQQIVIHSAAESSPFRTYAELEPTNVQGTENIIEACLQNHVERLIQISSTSIYFEFKDDFGIDDSRPLPNSFACGYAQSKAEAERRVLHAVDYRKLNAFVIRARAVFGHGDNALVPRILEAYDAGKLRQIGDRDNVTDLTHVDNLAFAVALAIENGDAGGVCTVAGGEPVRVWDVVRDILIATGRTNPLRSIPYPIAVRAAQVNEKIHRWFGWGEPKLTQFSVGLLAKSQSFKPRAAQEQLGYQPILPMKQAIAETIQSLKRVDNGHANETVELKLFSTGYTLQRYGAVERGQSLKQRIRIHAAIGVIVHPKHGLTLFDTGYAPRFDQITARFPFSLYRRLTPATTFAEHTAAKIVERLGFQPDDVQRILLSHFHGDHTCGLKDFPQADIIALRSAWHSVRPKKGISAVRAAYLPDSIPDDIENKLHSIDRFHDSGFGPFDTTFDLFGDGSIRLIQLPGHATGQFGALLQTGPAERKLLVADAVWTTATIAKPLDLTWPFKMIAASSAAAAKTHRRLVALNEQFPDVEILPTHCPEVAAAYQFNEMIDKSVFPST
jgi:nucleoside-diphosphate-sugar epimerase/glyoxylase-like metal-dependent hydrolase (beta-lactamase superfamily II)